MGHFTMPSSYKIGNERVFSYYEYLDIEYRLSAEFIYLCHFVTCYEKYLTKTINYIFSAHYNLRVYYIEYNCTTCISTLKIHLEFSK